MTDGPLIVQSDKTLLLEIDHADSDECRHAIAPFAELERAPEHVHTYRITPLGREVLAEQTPASGARRRHVSAVVGGALRLLPIAEILYFQAD